MRGEEGKEHTIGYDRHSRDRIGEHDEDDRIGGYDGQTYLVFPVLLFFRVSSLLIAHSLL